MNIGIVYIATGIYAELWKDFYPTCECFFCTDAEKGFEVFTDSPQLLSMQLRNVFFHSITDLGFIVNVSSKSKFICDMASTLATKYDYVFYMNGNFKFVEPILSIEVLPDSEHDYLTVLSFGRYYQGIPLEQLPYDRNPDCQAYIPIGEGVTYYQASFYGGRTLELLQLSEWCARRIDEDLRNRIVARFHDESYLNRYLLDRHPRTVDEVYAKPSFFEYSGPYKAILLAKETYLGYDRLRQVKGADMDGSLSFLLDDTLRIVPIGIVALSGRLGDQLFQYAFFLYLHKKFGAQRRFYLQGIQDVSLASLFPISSSCFLPAELSTGVAQAHTWQIGNVTERRLSHWQELEDSPSPIVFYNGSWQCSAYVEVVAEELKEQFFFSELVQKNETYDSCLLQQIESVCSVSIHVCRDALMIPENEITSGGICTAYYYQDAVSRMTEGLSEQPVFFVFTDDVAWVEKYLNIASSVLVDCSERQECWQVSLMAACRHHILANNSISWWGAWLSNSARSYTTLTVVPSRWCNGAHTPHLFPASWIRVSVARLGLLEAVAGNILLRSRTSLHVKSQRGRMADVLFLYHYARHTSNKAYGEMADNLLQALCKNMHKQMSASFSDGLAGICWMVTYLVRHGYVKGNINYLLSEVDTHLAELIHRKEIQDVSFASGLCGIGYYLVYRLSLLNASSERSAVASKKRLERVLGELLDYLLERAESDFFDKQNIRDVFLLLQDVAGLPIYRDKVVYLYIYSMSYSDDTFYLLPNLGQKGLWE